MRKNKFCLQLLLISGLLFYISFLLASSHTNYDLNKIQQQIQNVKQILFKHEKQKSDLQKELGKTELAMSQLLLNIQATERSLALHRETINDLMVKQNHQAAIISQNQQLLLQQLKFAYFIGMNKTNYRILLQAEHLNKVDRLLTYMLYLNLQRHHTITKLKQQFASLQKVKQLVFEQTQQLMSLKLQQSNQQIALKKNKQYQQMLLEKLALEVNSHSQQLQELLKNKKALEEVIKQLQIKNSYFANFISNKKERFPLPTKGKIIEQFGSSIQNSELKQNGILIAAPEGEKVYAVAPGRVVFAKWLPGYGLLIILDHGKGYMTLYGNNNILYKKEGDFVNSHTLIAAVGHTGGHNQSALYFAIRCQGKPINPNTWCHIPIAINRR